MSGERSGTSLLNYRLLHLLSHRTFCRKESLTLPYFVYQMILEDNVVYRRQNVLLLVVVWWESPSLLIHEMEGLTQS